MQPDSILLEKAQSSAKHLSRLIGQFWKCFPGVWGETLNLDWGKAALSTASDFILACKSPEGFENGLTDALYRSYYSFGSEFKRRINPTPPYKEHEECVDPDQLVRYLQTSYTADNTEYLMDLAWLEKQIAELLSLALTDQEQLVVRNEFWSTDKKKSYAGLPQQTYQDVRKRALNKLKDHPRAQWLFLQSREFAHP